MGIFKLCTTENVQKIYLYIEYLTNKGCLIKWQTLYMILYNQDLKVSN